MGLLHRHALVALTKDKRLDYRQIWDKRFPCYKELWSIRGIMWVRVRGGTQLGHYSWGKSVLFGLLTSLLGLLSLEAGVRLVDSARADLHGAGRRAAAAEPVSLIQTPNLGWVRKPGFNGKDFDGLVREFDPDGYFAIDTKKVADQTRKKILFIGDSNTFGYGVTPSSAFPEVVGELLPAVNTIDLGVIGYSSWQGAALLQEVLPRFKPAAVVASFNYNDRREILDDDEPDSSRRFEKIFRNEQSDIGKVNQTLEMFDLYRHLRAGMTGLGLLHQPVRGFQVDRLSPRVDENEYRKNLARIAAQTRQFGIPLIFVVLGDSPLEEGAVEKAIARLEASDADAAIDYLAPIARSTSWFSDLARIYLSKAYAAKGDQDQAAASLVSTQFARSIEGVRPIRLYKTYNQIMREVARENQVTVVEAAAALEKDPYVYIDFCHFGAMGHRKVAELVAPALAELLQKGAR